MAGSRALQRQMREQELVAATRRLFDQRGFHDVPVDEIAKAVGIAPGNIYRQFSSKEELFTLTVTTYLEELAPLLETATASATSPEQQLECCVEAFAGFCGRYPAFLDSSIFLMQRPATELQQMLAESVWYRLGQGMAECLGRLAGVLAALGVEDSDYLANVLWTQAIGVMHLSRIQVGVREQEPGVPALFPVTTERIVRTCVQIALATAGVRPAGAA